MGRYTAERILPSGLKAWCMRRNIVWECFCALVTDERVPVRFSSNDMGHSTALCHHNQSECGFLRKFYLSLFSAAFSDFLCSQS
jgi:hypothetical protein